MPGHACVDPPDTPHHVRVRGLERRAIFRDDAKRVNFVRRLGRRAGLAPPGVVEQWSLTTVGFTSAIAAKQLGVFPSAICRMLREPRRP